MSDEVGRQRPLSIEDLDKIAERNRGESLDPPTSLPPPRRRWTALDVFLALLFSLPVINLLAGFVERAQYPAPPDWTASAPRTIAPSDAEIASMVQPPAPPVGMEMRPEAELPVVMVERSSNPKAAVIDLHAIAQDCVEKRASLICMDQRLRRQPDSVRIDAYTALADAHRAQGNQANAIEAWTYLIGLRPNEAKYYNARCWQRFVWNRDLEAALADCTKALVLRPGDGNTLDSRGSVLLRLGRYDEAIADFSAAIAQGNRSAHAVYGRGLARQRSGQADAAKADIREAKEMASAIDQGFWMDDPFDGV